MATILTYALTSLADVKETLDIDSGITKYDNLIIRKINQATEMIERYCGGRRFAETTYSNVEYDATNDNTIVLRQAPITDTTTFVLQQRDTSLNESDWTTVDTELYFTDTAAGVVELLFNATGRWNRYRVTYSAGFATIPADLAEACATLSAFMFENGTTGAAIKRKEEGQREIEYYDPRAGSNSTSLIEQLGLDDMLDGYKFFPISEK